MPAGQQPMPIGAIAKRQCFNVDRVAKSKIGQIASKLWLNRSVPRDCRHDEFPKVESEHLVAEAPPVLANAKAALPRELTSQLPPKFLLNPDGVDRPKPRQLHRAPRDANWRIFREGSLMKHAPLE